MPNVEPDYLSFAKIAVVYHCYSTESRRTLFGGGGLILSP
jgi:hypothetical protein